MRPPRLVLRLDDGLRAALARTDTVAANGWPDPSSFDVQHELGCRSDVLVQQLDGVPCLEELRELADGEIALWQAQFTSLVFDNEVDAVMFSLQPEVEHAPWRHRREGYLVYPPSGWAARWSGERRRWFEERFAPAALLTPAEFKRSFARIGRAVAARSRAAVVVFNCSSIDPADSAHTYREVGSTLAVRAEQFNLALMELSAEVGVSIVDVDRVIAELGAGRHVASAFRYSDVAGRAIAAEALRVLAELGLAPTTPDVTAPTLKLAMPQVNRSIQGGSIIAWHKREGDRVERGEPLFDMRSDIPVQISRHASLAERIRYLTRAVDMRADELFVPGTTRPRVVRVRASDTGVVRRIYAAPGARHGVGDVLAVLTAQGNDPFDDTPSALSRARSFSVVADVQDGGRR